MSLILIVSIFIRFVALAWSIVLLRRLRDWRIGFLSVIFALMAARQTLTLLAEHESWQLSVTGHATELPGLVVSVMAFVAILFLDRLRTERQRTKAALRSSEKWFRAADEGSRRWTALTDDEFRRRFLAGLIAAWLIPPATGELGMCFLGFWDLRQAGLSLLRFTGVYVVAFTLIAYVVCKRQVLEPVAALADRHQEPDLAHATKLRAFPWVFWGLLTLYCCFGPATVLLSSAVFEGVRYTPGQYAFSMFGVVPFLLIAAFPMFFYLTDLLGRFLAPRGVVIVVAPVWLKVMVLGLFTPFMIDTILLLYYFNRTGFIEVETLVLWSLLILTAAVGTLFAFRSFRQGMLSLKQPLGGVTDVGSDAYPVPRSLDEFGLLAHGWADLLESRDRAEGKAAERDRLMRDIIDNTDAVIYIKDKEGRYLMINRRYELLFGLSKDEALGRTDYDIFSTQAADVFRQNDLKVMRDEEPLQIQEIVPHEDGPHSYISQKFPLYDAEGVLYGVCGISTDITDRKRAEDTLRERTRMLELFFKHTLGQVVFLDRDFNFIRVNDAYARACKRDVSEFPGHNHFEFYPSDAQAIFEEVVQTKQPFQTFARPFMFPDHPEWGVTYWDWTLVPVLDDAGEVDLLVLSMNDVTERARAKQALAVREHEQAVVAEMGQQVLAGLDPAELMDRIVERVAQTLNVEYCNVLERMPDGQSLLLRAGVGWKDGLVGSATVPARQDSQAGYTLLASEPVIAEDLRTETRFSGLALPFDQQVVSGVSVIIQGGDSPFGVLDVHSSEHRHFSDDDVNFLLAVANLLANAIQRKQAEEELRNVNIMLEGRVAERTAELQETNAELEAFAHSVSHDLRAPLRAMHGFAAALLEDYGSRLDSEGNEFARRIVDAANRMDGLINDLLAYSRISRVELHLRPVDLASVVKESLAQIDPEIQARRAQVSVEGPLPQVVGHHATLVQIVTNLLANAVKFVAKDARSQVRVWTEPRDGRIRFIVQDNGIGIRHEYHDRIFQVFERLHGIETYPGTGIGLAIVRRAAERLGGEVGLESCPGEGSRFWVEFPIAE